MPSRAAQLAHKRRMLVHRCQLQRADVGLWSAAIEARLSNTDRLLGAVGGVARNPLAIVGVVAGVMLIGKWRLLRWVGKAALMLGLARRVQRAVR